MEEGAGDPSLDVLSSRFDPLRALQAVSSDVSLPYPDIQACGSLDEYRSILRGSGRPAHRATPPGNRKGGVADDELVLPEVRQKPARAVKSVLTFMQSRWIKNKFILQLESEWIKHFYETRSVMNYQW